jgi:hypothetical protein
MFQNVLHSIHINALASTFDPASGIVNALATPFVNPHISMCIFKNRLFAIYNESGGLDDISVAELVAGAWGKIAIVDALPVGGGGSESQYALFTDGVEMFALYTVNAGASDEGWYVRSTTDGLTWNDISTTVLPTGLLSPNNGGTWNGNTSLERFAVVYDVDTVPGALTLNLYHAIDSSVSTILTHFQWNGNAAQITQIDTGGSAQDALPTGYPNAGERIWTAGERDIKITARTPDLLGEKLSFTAYGGGTGLNVKFYHTLLGHPVLLESTLVAPVTGGSATLNVGLNQVEGVAADGSTVYTIIWDFVTDSLSTGTRVERIGRVFA